jgi:hypothetical protein
MRIFKGNLDNLKIGANMFQVEFATDGLYR